MKNTVRKVRLEGELGEKFGEVWNLNVKTPHEAIKAIECQTKGFRKHILDNAEKGIGYEVIIGDQGIKQEEELLYPAPIRDDFTIVPIVQGAKSRGFGMIMMGAALFLTAGMASGAFGTAYAEGMVASGYVGGAFGGNFSAYMTSLMSTEGLAGVALQMGGAMVLGGAAMMLAPTIDGSPGDEEQSYLFDGAINSTKQGTPVPILYGRMIVGGAVISASIKSNHESTGQRGQQRAYVTGVGTGATVTSNVLNTQPIGCFIEGTMVEMADGTEKEITSIKLGDHTRGGIVYSTMQFLPQTIYDYKGVKVSGSHYVYEEGQFIEVEDSKHGILTDQVEPVHTLITSDHMIYSKGIKFGDYSSVDETEWQPYYKIIKDKINKRLAKEQI